MKSLTDILIAHRGDPSLAPENTLASIKAAIEAGAIHIEFDLQLTADGVPFLMHDASFKRTAGLDRLIYGGTLDHISQVKVSRSKIAEQAFEPVPVTTLSEAVMFLSDFPDIDVFIELKRESIGAYKAQPFVEAVLNIIEPIKTRCTLISFVLDAVIAIQRYSPCDAGWVLREYDDRTRSLAKTIKPTWLIIRKDLITSKKLWRGPWQWYVYDAESLKEVKTLKKRGADLVGTMNYHSLTSSA